MLASLFKNYKSWYVSLLFGAAVETAYSVMYRIYYVFTEIIYDKILKIFINPLVGDDAKPFINPNDPNETCLYNERARSKLIIKQAIIDMGLDPDKVKIMLDDPTYIIKILNKELIEPQLPLNAYTVPNIFGSYGPAFISFSGRNNAYHRAYSKAFTGNLDHSFDEQMIEVELRRHDLRIYAIAGHEAAHIKQSVRTAGGDFLNILTSTVAFRWVNSFFSYVLYLAILPKIIQLIELYLVKTEEKADIDSARQLKTAGYARDFLANSKLEKKEDKKSLLNEIKNIIKEVREDNSPDKWHKQLFDVMISGFGLLRYIGKKFRDFKKAHSDIHPDEKTRVEYLDELEKSCPTTMPSMFTSEQYKEMIASRISELKRLNEYKIRQLEILNSYGNIERPQPVRDPSPSMSELEYEIWPQIFWGYNSFDPVYVKCKDKRIVGRIVRMHL